MEQLTMKKSHLIALAFGILFLFLIQLAGTLVESIYILDLMNTSLDEKALGLLFFFSPALLLFSRKKLPVQFVWVLFGILFLARGLTPYLDTLGRMLASGIGVGAALLLFPLLMTVRPKDGNDLRFGLQFSAGLALAIGFSVFLRTVNYSLDYSLFPEGGWVGWGLGIALAFLLTPFDWNGLDEAERSSGSVTLPVVGVFLIFALALFAFSAPAVIARWTEGGYRLIAITVSLLALSWAGVSLYEPRWFARISPAWLLAWNLAFTVSLTGTILAHRVSFPPTPDSPAVVVGAPAWLQQLPLVLTLLLFPVIFLDLRVLYDRIQAARPTIRELVPGMLLGSLSLVLLVFMYIFTNVWGYVEPVSPWFRNKFWLPFLMMAGLLTLLVGWKAGAASSVRSKPESAFSWGWGALLAFLFLGTAGSVLYTTQTRTFAPRDGSLVVMTYNIQQANDDFGERSYAQQLALIRQVSPDVLALQESDAARISLNNNDYVRYYAGKLGYYSYYGPTTLTGTYGTAILSKYSLQNTHTVFTFSDQDEIGTAVAEIEIGSTLFTVYNVHPAGSDSAMLTFARTLLESAEGKSFVISLGDYNLRDYEEAYQLIEGELTNAWVSVYPSKIGADGTDMSGRNRIDHIFFSVPLLARNPVYILPPASATDHPVHWAELYWDESVR
jgi:endonuclease/exonuclease/phosphatase family metal-dependent hydrolase